jgi:hypothetical protein
MWESGAFVLLIFSRIPIFNLGRKGEVGEIPHLLRGYRHSDVDCGRIFVSSTSIPQNLIGLLVI